MKNIIISVLSIALIISLFGCKNNNNVTESGSPEFTVLEAASHGRDQEASDQVPVAEVSKNISITAATNYPIWRETISASIDISFVTTSKSFVSARVLPKIFIYPDGGNEPVFWSVINLSTSFALEPNVKTLLVLPVGSQKSISSPVTKLLWASMDMPWPHLNYYQLVPTGDYNFEFVLEIYDDDDKLVDTVRTPKQKYTSIFTAPEVVGGPGSGM